MRIGLDHGTTCDHLSPPPTQEKVCALENQAHQLGLQASQECERMAKDRTATLQMLQKVSVFVLLYRFRRLGLMVRSICTLKSEFRSSKSEVSAGTL